MRRARSASWLSFQPGTLAVRGLLAAGILCLAAGAGLWVAHPVTATSPAQTAPATVEDVQLTVQARQALSEDPRLGGLNLWVVVEERVATLTGPVPSAESAQLAEQRLRQLPGLVKVVNELRPERAEDAAVNAFRPLQRPRRPASELAQPAPRPATPTRHVASSRPRPPLTGTNTPRQPAEGEQEPLLTLPAIRLTVPAPAPTGTSVAKPPMPDHAEKPADLLDRLERIRQADARFRFVTIELVDGAVFLRGSVRRGEDQFDLAQQISRVPGVTRVVLAGVRVEPTPPAAPGH